MAAAAQATGSPHFSSLAFADPAISTPLLQEAHRRAMTAIKAARPDLPVGLTLTTQDIQSVGDPAWAEAGRQRLYGDWIEVARTHADFIGVQTYTRFRVDETGVVPPPEGAEMTDAGYEFYPQALANTIRWAHADDRQADLRHRKRHRHRTTTRAASPLSTGARGVRECLDDGIPVHSYLYWSLLDNFEWTVGLRQAFRLGRRRSANLRAHAEAQRAASRRHRARQPHLTTQPPTAQSCVKRACASRA